MKKIYIMLISGLSFLACEEAYFEPQPGNDQEAIFEEFWTTFNEGYAGFEERGVDWDQTYSTYRPQVDQNTSDQELVEIIKQMLSPLKDGHVKFTHTVEKQMFIADSYLMNNIDDELFDLGLIKEKYLEGKYTVNGEEGNTFGRIGNFGYLHLAFIHANMLEFNDILDSFSGTDGLIIDLRHNNGGDFTYAFSEMGRLTNSDKYAFRSKTKNGPGIDEYTEWFEWSLKPSGSYFDKPIVLITDRYTISAGERTTMILKSLGNVTHIGDTTNGAISTFISRELANGWYFTVCPQKVEFTDGINYEGAGIPPEIFVKNTAAEMEAGTDKTLEAALESFK